MVFFNQVVIGHSSCCSVGKGHKQTSISCKSFCYLSCVSIGSHSPNSCNLHGSWTTVMSSRRKCLVFQWGVYPVPLGMFISSIWKFARSSDSDHQIQNFFVCTNHWRVWLAVQLFLFQGDHSQPDYQQPLICPFRSMLYFLHLACGEYLPHESLRTYFPET